MASELGKSVDTLYRQSAIRFCKEQAEGLERKAEIWRGGDEEKPFIQDAAMFRFIEEQLFRLQELEK